MNFQEYVYGWSWDGYHPISVGWEQCEPRHSYGPGIREHHTIHFVLSGSGTFTVKNRTYSVGAGDMFCISPYESVHYEADEHDPWHYLWITFIINGTVPYMFTTPVVHAPNLQPIFLEIQNYPDHNNTGRDLVTNFLLEIANQLAPQQSDSNRIMNEVVKYIHNNYYNDSLSISEIADHLEISRSTLSIVFSLELGISPIEYLIRYRLEKACGYMTIYKLSPTIAAYSVGYKNYNNFTKIFKKYYGISPREYQKNST